MAFTFGQKPQTPPQTQPQPAAEAKPNPFGGPPSAAFRQGPISAQTAMAGMSGAEVDVRYPKLDPGQQYHVQIEDAHYFNGRNIGLAIFVDVKVLESSEEGSIGQMRSIKIDGFSNENARNFAFSDAKMLLIAAWHYQGLTKDWKGDGQPQPWERFLDQNVTNKDPEKDQQEFPTLVGKRLYIQTSEIETKFVEPKTGQKARKLKHLFAPARETL